MARLLKQSSTAQPLIFFMADSADHVSAKTGLSPTVTLSKAGGTFASPSGVVTEIANGFYKVAGNATDTNTLGPLILHASAAGADPADVLFDIVAFDPQDAASLGLFRIDAAVSSRSSHTAADIWAVATRALTDKAGFSLANGSIAAATFAAGAVDATAFAQGAADKVWSTAARTITGGTIGTYTGNTPQTGDAFARLGAAGAGLTALGDTRIAHLDADVSSRLAAASYTAPDNADIVTALADLVTLLGRTDPTTALTAVKAITDRIAPMLNGATPDKFTAAALSLAPAGGGGGSTINDEETIILGSETITVT